MEPEDIELRVSKPMKVGSRNQYWQIDCTVFDVSLVEKTTPDYWQMDFTALDVNLVGEITLDDSLSP
jgi:hypothetical protein